MARLDDRAKEAIYEDTRVGRRASLSRGGGRDRTGEREDDGGPGDGQARLSDYSS